MRLTTILAIVLACALAASAPAQTGTPDITVRLVSRPRIVAPGAYFEIAWRIEGATRVTHTNLHWGADPLQPANYTTAQSGGPGDYTELIQAPASGPMHFRVHVIADGEDGNAQQFAIEVGAVPAAPVVSFTRFPRFAEDGEVVTLGWQITAPGPVLHTNVHWGTDPKQIINMTASQTGWSGDYEATIVAPSSGTVYYQWHVIDATVDDFGPLQQIDVAALPPDPGLAGPHTVAETSLRLPALSRPTPLEVEVYFPATSTGASAPLAGGPYPVVVFGHGRRGLPPVSPPNFIQYRELLRHLASYGRVVATVELDHNSPLLPKDNIEADRDDLLAALDDLLDLNRDPTSPFRGALDAKRRILGGHSRGGEGALAAAEALGAEAVFALSPTDFSRPRPKVPALLLSVSEDYDVPHPIQQGIFHDLAEPRFLHTLLGGDHFKYLDDQNSLAIFRRFTALPAVVQHQLARRAVQRFLGYVLSGGAGSGLFGDLADREGETLTQALPEDGGTQVDDFESSASGTNLLGRPAGGHAGVRARRDHEGRLELTVSGPGNYITELGTARRPLDVSAHTHLSLRAEGLRGGEALAVTLEDAAGSRARVLLTERAPLHVLPRSFRVDLGDFAGVDLARLTRLELEPGPTTGGVLRVDDIRFR